MAKYKTDLKLENLFPCGIESSKLKFEATTNPDKSLRSFIVRIKGAKEVKKEYLIGNKKPLEIFNQMIKEVCEMPQIKLKTGKKQSKK